MWEKSCLVYNCPVGLLSVWVQSEGRSGDSSTPCFGFLHHSEPADLWESSGPQKTQSKIVSYPEKLGICPESVVYPVRSRLLDLCSAQWLGPCFVSKSNCFTNWQNPVLSVCSGPLKRLFSSWFQWCMMHRMMNWQTAFWRCLRIWLPAHWPGMWFITCCNIRL